MPFCLQTAPAREEVLTGVSTSLVRSFHSVTSPEVIPFTDDHSFFKVHTADLLFASLILVE